MGILKRRRGIDELLIEPCCAVKYYPEMETCENEIFMEEDENRDARCQNRASQINDTFTQLTHLTYPASLPCREKVAD